MATTAASAATAATINPGPKPAGAPIDEPAVRRVLAALLDRAVAAAPDAEYRLVGTASSVLRGVRLPAGDIDILLRARAGVDSFGAAIMELPTAACQYAPSWNPDHRQYFGRYVVDGITVELSTVESATASDAMECFGTGPWTHFDLVSCGPYEVPTVATELRLITELARNRPERYGPIIDYLREHGCDAALVQRGMAARRVSEARQAEVLAQLVGPPA
jgi:hypothetical protein